MPLLTFYGAPDLLRYRGRAGGDSGDTLEAVQDALTGNKPDYYGEFDPANLTPEQRAQAKKDFASLDKNATQEDFDRVNSIWKTKLVKREDPEYRGGYTAGPDTMMSFPPSEPETSSVQEAPVTQASTSGVPLSSTGTMAVDDASDSDWLSRALSAAGGYIGDAWDAIKAGAGLLASPVIGVANAAESLSKSGREQGKPIYGMLKDKDGNPVLDENGRPQYGIIGYDDSKVLMDDGKTWRDRNFMDTAFDVLRGVDRYVDPATKYFRKGMEQAATHPMGWSLAARDPQGPWATAIKGATAQREMELKERGQGNAINTMMYDINRHIDENYGPMTPEARENLVMELASRQLPLMKANQTQFNLGDSAEKARFETQVAADRAVVESYATPTADYSNRLDIYNRAVDAAAKSPGYLGGGNLGEFVKGTMSDLSALPGYDKVAPAITAGNIAAFSRTKEQTVKGGGFSDADANRVDSRIVGMGSSPLKASVYFTQEAIADARDMAIASLMRTAPRYGSATALEPVVVEFVNSYSQDAYNAFANDIETLEKKGKTLQYIKPKLDSEGYPVTKDGKVILSDDYTTFNSRIYVNHVLKSIKDFPDFVRAGGLNGTAQ